MTVIKEKRTVLIIKAKLYIIMYIDTYSCGTKGKVDIKTYRFILFYT